MLWHASLAHAQRYILCRSRQRLRAIVADPKSRQKHVWRARIVLLSGDGLGISSIMTKTGKSKTCVWRWQERFMHEGVDGLLRDKSRPPGKAPIPPDRVAEIVRLTQQTAAARSNPLDAARDGEDGWRCRVDGPGDLEGARPQPALNRRPLKHSAHRITISSVEYLRDTYREVPTASGTTAAGNRVEVPWFREMGLGP